MDQFWANTIDRVTFAFQPILSAHDGRIIAVEALLRSYREAGFSSIQDVFDLAWNDGKLVEVETALREKSFRLFSLLPLSEEVSLFSNLDNRVLTLADWRPESIRSLVARTGLEPARLVLEVSERSAFTAAPAVLSDMNIALDDFGTGYSGLQTVWRLNPAYLKIDRFFVTGADQDPAKQSFLEAMVALGHAAGSLVIAEGVETAGEVACCLRSGCDALQGFAVGYPAFNGESFRCISFDRQGLLFPQVVTKLGG